MLCAFPGPLRFPFFFSLPKATRLSFLDAREPPLPQNCARRRPFPFLSVRACRPPFFASRPSLPEVEVRNASCSISDTPHQFKHLMQIQIPFQIEMKWSTTPFSFLSHLATSLSHVLSDQCSHSPEWVYYQELLHFPAKPNSLNQFRSPSRFSYLSPFYYSRKLSWATPSASSQLYHPLNLIAPTRL